MKIFQNFRNWIFFDGENHKLECLFLRIAQIVITILNLFAWGMLFICLVRGQLDLNIHLNN